MPRSVGMAADLGLLSDSEVMIGCRRKNKEARLLFHHMKEKEGVRC